MSETKPHLPIIEPNGPSAPSPSLERAQGEQPHEVLPPFTPEDAAEGVTLIDRWLAESDDLTPESVLLEYIRRDPQQVLVKVLFMNAYLISVWEEATIDSRATAVRGLCSLPRKAHRATGTSRIVCTSYTQTELSLCSGCQRRSA